MSEETAKEVDNNEGTSTTNDVEEINKLVELSERVEAILEDMRRDLI